MKTQRMILIVVLTIVLLFASAGNAPLAAQSTPDPEPAQVDHTGALTLTWKRSTMWTGDFGGPFDSSGRHWQHTQFDDSTWTTTSIPNNGTDNGQSDYYYRAHFTWDGSSPLAVRFASDDGLQVYINGTQLGQWGTGWRIPGCVNVSSCLFNSVVPDQAVPTYMLQPGDNVIAIDLWNSTSGTYSLDAAVIPAPVDFTISHIEITQVTQDVNNEVPLIAGKDTLVRVYVSCTPSMWIWGNGRRHAASVGSTRRHVRFTRAPLHHRTQHK